MMFTVEETRWHGSRYYAVKPREWDFEWDDVIEWCSTAFGSPGDLWTTKAERYYLNSGKVFFREQTDLSMFILRNS